MVYMYSSLTSLFVMHLTVPHGLTTTQQDQDQTDRERCNLPLIAEAQIRRAERAARLTHMASQDCRSYYTSVAEAYAERWADMGACSGAQGKREQLPLLLQSIKSQKKAVCRLQSLSSIQFSSIRRNNSTRPSHDRRTYNPLLVCAAPLSPSHSVLLSQPKLAAIYSTLFDAAKMLRAQDYPLDLIFEAPGHEEEAGHLVWPPDDGGSSIARSSLADILPKFVGHAAHTSGSQIPIKSFSCPTSPRYLSDAARFDVEANVGKIFSPVGLFFCPNASTGWGRLRCCRTCSLLGLLASAPQNVEIRVKDDPKLCEAALQCAAAHLLPGKDSGLVCKYHGLQISPNTTWPSLPQDPSGAFKKCGKIEPLCDPSRTPALLAKLSSKRWMNETIVSVCRPLSSTEVQKASLDYGLVIETPGDEPYSSPTMLSALARGSVIVQTSITAAYVQPGLFGVRSGFFRVASECDMKALVYAVSTNTSVFAQLGKAQRAFSQQCLNAFQLTADTAPAPRCQPQRNPARIAEATRAVGPHNYSRGHTVHCACAADVELTVAALKAFSQAQGRCAYSHAVKLFEMVQANGKLFTYSATSPAVWNRTR